MAKSEHKVQLFTCHLIYPATSISGHIFNNHQWPNATDSHTCPCPTRLTGEKTFFFFFKCPLVSLSFIVSACKVLCCAHALFVTLSSCMQYPGPGGKFFVFTIYRITCTWLKWHPKHATSSGFYSWALSCFLYSLIALLTASWAFDTIFNMPNFFLISMDILN